MKQKAAPNLRSRFFAWSTGLIVLSGYVGASLPQPGPVPFVLEYPAAFGNRFRIPADNPTTVEGVYLGRVLFYEKRLSKDNSVSCGSCHRQELAFTDGRVRSRGVGGALAERNAMSLANLLWVRHFFWDGRAESLEKQACFPLASPAEMAQPPASAVSKLRRTAGYGRLFEKAFGDPRITSGRIVRALAQFERTLISSRSSYDRYLAGTYQPTALELRGMQLFETRPDPAKNKRGGNCAHCHGGPRMHKELFHNTGLDSLPADEGRKRVTGLAADAGRFRVPTLRNIMLTAPYMHDGRFATIDEVLDHYSEHLAGSATLAGELSETIVHTAGRRMPLLTRDEKEAITAFLRMLTDSAFISDPAFSDPRFTSAP